MARYILIDSHSGFVWGDSADLDGKVFSGSAIEYARALDESLGEHDREYIEHHRAPDGAEGYFVYRADVNSSDAVMTVWDGQDRETIESVERDCQPEGFIETKIQRP
jgi:hypothetical protein